MSEPRTASEIAAELVEKVLDVFARHDIIPMRDLELRQELYDMFLDEMGVPDEESAARGSDE